jgi:hypothetical protein
MNRIPDRSILYILSKELPTNCLFVPFCEIDQPFHSFTTRQKRRVVAWDLCSSAPICGHYPVNRSLRTESAALPTDQADTRR